MHTHAHTHTSMHLKHTTRHNHPKPNHSSIMAFKQKTPRADTSHGRIKQTC